MYPYWRLNSLLVCSALLVVGVMMTCIVSLDNCCGPMHMDIPALVHNLNHAGARRNSDFLYPFAFCTQPGHSPNPKLNNDCQSLNKSIGQARRRVSSCSRKQTPRINAYH
ncbi:hypothetical protein EDB82DRAFT_343831 [Fusarium venenatum]|uniref:uncharacterized protein n=1 Tax=Fusarium venenatum TaxID=56646 RepID=UPI001E185A70|nr:hypothetical protein EDB82DRAFT_343831 [Fusarium venenatum]